MTAFATVLTLHSVVVIYVVVSKIAAILNTHAQLFTVFAVRVNKVLRGCSEQVQSIGAPIALQTSD